MSPRILVVANETIGNPIMHEFLATIDDSAEVLIVAPTLGGRLAFWTSDDRDARRVAEERLLECVEALRERGLAAEGIVGDADPLIAMTDALPSFPADTIVVVTHPPERSHWLEREVVTRARERFDVPIVHLVAHELAHAP